MSQSTVLEPKEDITAFELANIMIIANTARDKDFMFNWLIEKCPSAIRHFAPGEFPSKAPDAHKEGERG